MPTDQQTQTLHGQKAKFALGYRDLGMQTWAWMQPNGLLGESNSGLVASGDQVLLIDTLWDLKLTQRMLDAAKELTGVFPQTIFNTHSDGDHVWGNQLLPDARIVSSSTAKALMEFDTPKELRAMQRGGKALRKIGSLPLPFIGTRDYGNLPRLPLRDMGYEFAPFDWSDVELKLPTETFDGSMTLEIGDRRVDLIEVGPAHTGGDSVAWVPDVKVCFAADILFIGGTPIMWAGPVSGWIAALDRVSGLGAETFVPGHGPVCTQREVDALRDYFHWIESEGGAKLARGVDPARAARELLFSDEFANSPWATWDDAARLVVTLCTEQHVQNGGKDHLLGTARTKAVVQMQRTKADLARRSARA
jgi:glyoxylase-like metal-dependent hydrolase (beta-lactamase superfamily II)